MFIFSITNILLISVITSSVIMERVPTPVITIQSLIFPEHLLFVGVFNLLSETFLDLLVSQHARLSTFIEITSANLIFMAVISTFFPPETSSLRIFQIVAK